MKKKKKITDEVLRKLVYLIPARYFYDGIVTSKKARGYQDYIEFQCQTYRSTKTRKDWYEVKRLTKEYEEYLNKEVDIKRKLLLFGLLKRDSKERIDVYSLLVKKYHLELMNALKMARILKWLKEVLRFMCLNYILPIFVFYIVYLFTSNSKISIVFFSITLLIGLVMNFRKMKE